MEPKGSGPSSTPLEGSMGGAPRGDLMGCRWAKPKSWEEGSPPGNLLSQLIGQERAARAAFHAILPLRDSDRAAVVHRR